VLNSYWRNWVWSVEWITLVKGWADTNMVMQGWITSELVSIELKSPTINCLIQLLFVTVIGVCVYTNTHIQRGISNYCRLLHYGVSFYIWTITKNENNEKIKNNCCHISNSVARVCSVRSPRVHSKDRRSYAGRLHTSDNDHCRTNRNQNLQMTCNNIWLSTKMQNNVSMSMGFVFILTWV